MAGPVPSPFGRPYWLALALVVAAWLTLTSFLTVSPHWVQPAIEGTHLLQVASFMVAIAIGCLAISRWYLTSDAPALWVGIALLIYGIVRLGAAEIVPVIIPDETLSQWLVWLRPASQIVLVAMLARAATMVPVSTTLSGPKVVLSAVVGVILAALVLQLLPSVATTIDGAQGALPRAYSAVNVIGITPFAFAALAVVFTYHGFRRRRWLFAWIALMLFTVALGDVVRVTAPPPVEAGLLGKEVLRLLGLVLALTGATREILYTYRDHSTRLARSEYTAMTAEERIRAGQADAEERAHEARSALAAIEGATRTLEHYRDRLPAETQAALSTAVSGEIRRLQRLVSVDESIGDLGPFSLAESVGPLVATEHARGVEVVVRVPGDLDVIGNASATQQVIQALFDNARRYAAGTRLTVRAERQDDWVVLRIEDRGPGVPADQREAIFRRGVRGETAVAGSGLGLYVAAKLMREQNGELWVDERPGGGASFALALPAAQSQEQDEITDFKRSDVGTDVPFSAARRGH